MVFPPAIAALGLVEQSHVGETYDLILGVDGQRIRRISDFQDAVSDARLGDIIYVTVLRAGKRLQIPMRIAQRDNRPE
jgi:S1-C subfamily serine protease